MKTVRRAGIIVLILLVLLVIISFFLPANVHVERTAVIKAQPDVVFKQVNDLHNWNNWMPWNKLDPEMKIKYTGPEEGIGAGYSWSSEDKHVGKGKIAITESKPDQLVVTALDFMENGTATGSFKMEPADGGTRITWRMDMDMGMNPIGRYLGLFMDQMMGGDFEQGLDDLKKVSESYSPPPMQEINPTPEDSTSSMEKPS